MKESDHDSPEGEFDFEMGILVMAKKTKLSFEELNLLSLNDFFNYLDSYTEDLGERKATQSDIDDFYKYM